MLRESCAPAVDEEKFDQREYFVMAPIGGSSKAKKVKRTRTHFSIVSCRERKARKVPLLVGEVAY